MRTVEERKRRGEKLLLVGHRGQKFEKISGCFVVCGEMKFFLGFCLKRISTKTCIIFKAFLN